MSFITISYPLALPTTPAPTDTDINLEYGVGEAVSPFSFSRQTHDWGGRRWRARVTLRLMKRPQADEWLSCFSLLRGKRGTFLMGDWDRRLPRGTITGTPAVNGAGQTGNALEIDGVTPGSTWLKGSHFQLESRLYRLVVDFTADAGSGGGSIAMVVTRGFGSFGSIAGVVTRGYLPASGGGGTIQFEPNLRSAPADGALLTYINAKGLFAMAQNYIPSPSDLMGVHRFSFEAIEAL